MRTEDGYIIYRCLNGDSSAFGFLVDKYKAGVYAVAYERLHNFHDAEDIAQEAFLKAYRSLRTLRHWDSFASWLYRITLNLCKDWLRVREGSPGVYRCHTYPGLWSAYHQESYLRMYPSDVSLLTFGIQHSLCL